jgi:hypothetical protein
MYSIVQGAEHLIVFVKLFPSTAEMGKACGTYGGQENCMESFVGGPKGKGALARPTKKKQRKERKQDSKKRQS